MAEFTFSARGCARITALHETTLEITKEEVKTNRGSCIVATCADMGLSELSQELKDALRTDGAKIALIFEAGGITDTVNGYGYHGLSLTNSLEMVVRKSTFICGRTLMVGADKAACNLKRELVSALKKPDTVAIIKISVQV